MPAIAGLRVVARERERQLSRRNSVIEVRVSWLLHAQPDPSGRGGPLPFWNPLRITTSDPVRSPRLGGVSMSRAPAGKSRPMAPDHAGGHKDRPALDITLGTYLMAAKPKRPAGWGDLNVALNSGRRGHHRRLQHCGRGECDLHRGVTPATFAADPQ
jgi:hypothetical protein